MSSGSTPFTSTPPIRSPFASIISLITNGAAPAHFFHLLRHHDDVAILVEVQPVFQDEDVGVHAQHLVAESVLKAAGDAQHREQRPYAERHTGHSDDRDERYRRALLRAEVTEPDCQGIRHQRLVGAC